MMESHNTTGATSDKKVLNVILKQKQNKQAQSVRVVIKHTWPNLVLSSFPLSIIFLCFH